MKPEMLKNLGKTLLSTNTNEQVHMSDFKGRTIRKVMGGGGEVSPKQKKNFRQAKIKGKKNSSSVLRNKKKG